MSCDNTYINNKPLGLSFSNTTTKPVGLAELSSITVNTVSATYWSGITLSSLSDINFAGLDDGYVISWDAGNQQWHVVGQIGGSGSPSNSFSIFVPTTGSNVVADNSADTLTFVSDGTVVVSGNSSTDTLSITVNEANLAGIPQSAVTNLTTSLAGKQDQNAILDSLSNLVAGPGSMIYFTDPETIDEISTTTQSRAFLATSANLDDITNVSAPSPSVGQTLTYNGTNWIPSSIVNAGASVSSLSGMNDVTITSPANGDRLVYSSSVGEWVNRPIISWPLFILAGTTSVELTNQAETDQFLGNNTNHITMADLSPFNEVRLGVRVATNSASPNNPRLEAVYAGVFSTTIGDYSDIGDFTVSASLSTAGYVFSNWITLATDAKTEVAIAIIQAGGNASADPAVSNVRLEFR